jgi:hypothetical protein
LYKLLRGDFYYPLPVEGFAGFIVAFVARVIIKVVCDFSGIVHFRHPNDLGGIYWTFNILVAVVYSYVAIDVFYNSSASENCIIDRDAAYLYHRWLVCVFFYSFSVFLLLSDRKYWKTFFSTKSGRRSVMDRFTSDSDVSKASVLKKNRNMWREIEPQVEMWVRDNWDAWEHDEPSWFTDSFKSHVDESWLTVNQATSKASVAEKRKAMKERKTSLLMTAIGEVTSFVSIAPENDPDDDALGAHEFVESSDREGRPSGGGVIKTFR